MKRPPFYQVSKICTQLPNQKDNGGRSLEKKPVNAHPFCPHRFARPLVRTVFPTDSPSTWNQTNDLTSFNYTTFRIIDRKDVYSVCDEVEIEIIARDGFNRKRKVGGDYFRVKAITMNATFWASTASEGRWSTTVTGLTRPTSL